MFIDEIAYVLFAIGFVGVLTLYMTVSVYYNYRKNIKKKDNIDIYSIISGGLLPIGAIGIYLFIISLWGQLTWPLPGSYNILFFDPLMSLSIVLIGFAWAVKTKHKMHYVGLFSLLVGLMTIDYGITGYLLNLTQSPLGFMGLFVAFGLVGVFAFPVSLVLDNQPGKTSSHPRVWFFFVLMFWIFLIIASVLAFMIAGLALYPHLSTPP